jgi:hypothetical protein
VEIAVDPKRLRPVHGMRVRVPTTKPASPDSVAGWHRLDRRLRQGGADFLARLMAIGPSGARVRPISAGTTSIKEPKPPRRSASSTGFKASDMPSRSHHPKPDWREFLSRRGIQDSRRARVVWRANGLSREAIRRSFPGRSAKELKADERDAGDARKAAGRRVSVSASYKRPSFSSPSSALKGPFAGSAPAYEPSPSPLGHPPRPSPPAVHRLTARHAARTPRATRRQPRVPRESCPPP